MLVVRGVVQILPPDLALSGIDRLCGRHAPQPPAGRSFPGRDADKMRRPADSSAVAIEVVRGMSAAGLSQAARAHHRARRALNTIGCGRRLPAGGLRASGPPLGKAGRRRDASDARLRLASAEGVRQHGRQMPSVVQHKNCALQHGSARQLDLVSANVSGNGVIVCNRAFPPGGATAPEGNASAPERQRMSISLRFPAFSYGMELSVVLNAYRHRE